MARATATPPPPSRPVHSFTLTSYFHPNRGLPPNCNAGHLPSPSHSAAPPPPPSPNQLHSRRGCTSPVPPLCSTGHCDSHSHSRRCPHHRLSVPQPVPPAPLALLARPAHVVRQVAPLRLLPTVWASAPPTAPVGSVSDALPFCRTTKPTSWNLLHQTVWGSSATHTAPALVAWCMILFPCLETAKGRLAGDDRRGDPYLSRLFTWPGSTQLPSSMGS